jgi:protein TonB
MTDALGSFATSEIWSKRPQLTRVQALSLTFHILFVALIVLPVLTSIVPFPMKLTRSITFTPIDLKPYRSQLPVGADAIHGGGSGGERNLDPAGTGALPPFAMMQLVPPQVKVPANPELAVAPNVVGPPEITISSPRLPNWGDPNSNFSNDSSGPGHGGGIGNNCCGGVGNGGDGVGVGPGAKFGIGGDYPRAGTAGYSEPVCMYCPNPQFSDEAVKQKYQGIVILNVVITADGRATNIHVVRGLGLGLDEKAIEAVGRWRFSPAIGPGQRPVAVSTNIEVTFRLY